MTNMMWIVLMGRIVCIAALLSLIGWTVVYTRLAKWWQNQIGRTLVAKTLLIAALLIPTTVNLFFPLNPYVMAWTSIALIGAITPVMIWRSVVWVKIARNRGIPGREI